MAVATYTKSGTKATTAAQLNKDVFGILPENHELLKSAYVAYLANGRLNLAVTKTRGLVSGGGRKPWRQKGTGRARFGSSRNPIWRGGGIAFGPTGLENYKHHLSLQQRRQAIRQALSMAAEESKIIVIEDFEIKNSKTSELNSLLSKVGVTRNTLLAVEHKTDDLTRSSKNLGKVKLVQAKYINVFDVMNADHIVITKSALNAVHEWLGSSK